jgi:hypothetical protein
MNSKVSELAEKINRITNRPSFPDMSLLEHDLLLQHLRDFYQELEALRITQTATVKEHVQIIEAVASMDKTELPEKISAKENKEPISAVAADKPESKISLNENITSESGLNEKLKPNTTELHQKIGAKSLKELIDLNKRFAIVNDLFHGDTQAFSIAIMQVDNASGFKEADDYVRNHLMKNLNWDAQSQSCKLFLKLLKQKFGEQ